MFREVSFDEMAIIVGRYLGYGPTLFHTMQCNLSGINLPLHRAALWYILAMRMKPSTVRRLQMCQARGKQI